MARIVHLDEHVGRVLSSVLDLADDPQCYLLVFDAVELSVLRQMVFPYVRYPTRLVEDYGLFQKVVDVPAWYADMLDCLETKLTGGANVACDLTAVLEKLATAIQTSGGAGGYDGCGPATNVLGCIGGMDDDQFLDSEPESVDPNGETPPDGFETMAAYLDYKCKAANVIVGWLIGWARGIAGMGAIQLALATVGPMVAALLSGLGVISLSFPPSAVVALVAAILAVGLLATGAFWAGNILADYIEDNKSDLICELYKSGSAAAALDAIAAVIEDAMQSVEMAALLAGLPEGAGTALGALWGTVQTNSLVKPLFTLVADIAFTGADCSDCGLGDCEPVLYEFTASNEGFDTFESTPGGRFTGAWSDGHLTYSGTSQNGQNAATWTNDGYSVTIKPGGFVHVDIHVDACQTTGPSYYLMAAGPDLFASTYVRPDTTGTFHIELNLASAEGKELTTIVLQCTDNVSGNAAPWAGYWDNLEVCA